MAKIAAKPAAKATKVAAKVEAPKVDIANINRTSDVSMADYINTLSIYAPEQLEDIVDPSTVSDALGAIQVAGDLFVSSTGAAIEKTVATKVAAAVRALTNDAPLTGYAGRKFDAEAFAAKVAPKKGRARLSPEEKAKQVMDSATPEQLDALAALLAERGVNV